ncbi:MAG TPA: ABC transporter permease [Bryobacteraceae bacterium]|nr:ABC transporter permease [Bryobacteraceae bacterium]
MDLKYALRSLRNNPGFALLAVIVMALGIGANTAVFSVVNAVLLRPLVFNNPDRIVTISPLWRKSGHTGGNSSAPDFHDWHDQSTAFDAMGDYWYDTMAVMAGGAAEFANVASISPEFFLVFSAEPVTGRAFVPEDWSVRAAAVVSQAYALAHFGANANALDKIVSVNQRTYSIVGVMPAGFDYPEKTAIWLPQESDAKENRSAHNFWVVGRLKAGISLQQAQAQMTSIGDRLSKQYPAEDGAKSVAVIGMRDRLVRNVRTTLYLLLGAVAMVLLIACANTANLLLARATSRTREIAIRAAVGASRWRIVRQLITESVVLAMAAGTLGFALAIWAADVLVAIAPSSIPRLRDGSIIDFQVLGFTLAVSIAASLLFGLAPALTAASVDLNDALKLGGNKSVVGGGTGKLRNALVVAEIALSVVLLVGAGLLMKSFAALTNAPMGFKPDHLLLMTADVPSQSLDDGRRATQFYKLLMPEIARMPGVTAVSATRAVPGSPASDGTYGLDGPMKHGFDPDRQAVFSIVAPRAFATFGIPLIAGREFNDGDTYDAPFVAIINEALAKKALPGQNPIGHTIVCGFDSLTPMTIVGVVGDVRQYGPASAPQPELFMAYEQHPEASAYLMLVARTHGEPQLLSESMRRLVRDKSPEVPIKFTTMEASLKENIAAPRFRTLLFALFAGLAVCLAMAGVYGVTAYAVGQRLNEIGLRMALGATPGAVLGLVLKQGMILAGAGLALGLAGAAAATRLLTSFLFEVKPGDPLTYLGVSALLAAVSVAASYVPAKRATKVDPLVALRGD